MRTTAAMLSSKITYANQVMTDREPITNCEYNGFNHLRVNGENIFTGTKKECVEFLDGLVQFYLLTR